MILNFKNMFNISYTQLKLINYLQYVKRITAQLPTYKVQSFDVHSKFTYL